MNATPICKIARNFGPSPKAVQCIDLVAKDRIGAVVFRV
jgi:hypothetical protein